VGSLFLAHWSEALVVRIYYFLSTLWLGVGLTLLMSLALAWFALAASRLAGIGLKPVSLGTAALGFTLVYSAYGVWNALHPRVVRYTVPIKNLPAAWRGKTLAHISDIHLGRVLRTGFLKRVVRQVNAENPAMVLITGDLFDGADGKLEELAAPLNELVAPKGIYFVTGNHETYLGVKRSFLALRDTPVKALDDAMELVDGLQIVGISYPERGHGWSFSQKMRELKGYDPASPSVLLFHSPSQIAEAKVAGINLQLSGHVHQAQLFPLQFFTRMIFGKYHHGLHTEGEFTLYTSSGTGLWGPTMRTGNHPEIAVIRLEAAE
jgi:predicted MPP superfamily phosphohydrolase